MVAIRLVLDLSGFFVVLVRVVCCRLVGLSVVGSAIDVQINAPMQCG